MWRFPLIIHIIKTVLADVFVVKFMRKLHVLRYIFPEISRILTNYYYTAAVRSIQIGLHFNVSFIHLLVKI